MMLTPFKGINQDPRKYIWMSPTGDDNNTGEKDYPVKSLRVAMELSRKYHKNILVRDGTYNINDNPQTGTTYPVFESGMDGTFEYGYESEIVDSFIYDESIRIYGSSFISGEYIPEIDLLTFTSVTAVKDTSGSYSVITVSPDPSWTPNSLVGKRLYFRSGQYSYSYVIISNTSNTIVVNYPLSGDMKYGSSIVAIGRCPVFTNTPPNLNFYNNYPISFINLNFNIGSAPNVLVGGISNKTFVFCYFSKPSAGNTPIYVNNGHLTLECCVLNGLRIGHKTPASIVKSIPLINCRFTSVINNTEAAYYDVDTLIYCSAFNCYDIIHTGGYNYNNFGNRNMVITNFGGSGNTGAFIRHHSSYTRNQFLNIILNWSGSNTYTIDTRSIIPEEGVQLSLDTLSLQNVAAKQVIIYEDDLTRIIGKL